MTWTEVFNDTNTVLKLTLIIAAIGILISSAEWLASYPLFKNDHFFSWSIRKIRTKAFIKHSFYDRIYGYPNVLVLIIIQILAAIALLVFNDVKIVLLLCSGIIALATTMFSLRSYAGYTGADQMLKIIFITGFLSQLTATRLGLIIGMLFLSGQLIIAYATPGILRLFEKDWKNGNHLLLVTRQHTYGHRIAFNFLKSFRSARVTGAWLIMTFEFGALFALFLPLKLLLVYLLFGILFHLSNAVIMGLNTFTWAFVATYPAFIWTSVFIRNFL